MQIHSSFKQSRVCCAGSMWNTPALHVRWYGFEKRDRTTQSTWNMFQEVFFATKVVLGDVFFHARWGILQVSKHVDFPQPPAPVGYPQMLSSYAPAFSKRKGSWANSTYLYVILKEYTQNHASYINYKSLRYSIYLCILSFVMVQWVWPPLLRNTLFHNAGEQLLPPKDSSNLPTSNSNLMKNHFSSLGMMISMRIII